MVMEAGGWLNGGKMLKRKRFYISEMTSQKQFVPELDVEIRLMDLAPWLTKPLIYG